MLLAGRAIGLVPARIGRTANAPQLNAALEELGGLVPAVRSLLSGKIFPEGFAKFEPHFGHVPRYGVPGAVLLGDAAHPVTPAGGQGANMAVADAVALAREILVAALPEQVCRVGGHASPPCPARRRCSDRMPRRFRRTRRIRT